jgi:CHAT domain-containing protein/tetratricopeptide (TPR) repeat protein
VSACRHLSKASQFRRLWKKASLKGAIAEYEEALRLWKNLGDLRQEAITLKNTGDVWEIISEWQKSLSCYEKALAIYSQLDDLFGETEVMNALSTLYIYRSEYQKALDIYTPAHRAVEDPWQTAKRVRNLGAAYYELGEMQKATDYQNQALKLEKLLGDRVGQAYAFLNLAYINHAAKNLSAAEKYYQQSIEAARDAEHPRVIATAQAALGHLLNLSGERQEAWNYYRQSLTAGEEIGDISIQYMALEGIGYMYAGLGDNEKAIDYYLKAMAMTIQVSDLSLEGNIRSYLSDTYRKLGDYKNALHHSQKAVHAYKSISSQLGESYALASMGKALEALGRLKEADESYIRALFLARKVGDRFLEGLLLDALGHLYHKWDRLPKAREYYRQALDVQDEVDDSVQMSSTLYNLARAERDAGNLDLALQYAEKGLEIIESLRGKVASLELRGTFLASVHRQYELRIGLLIQQHKVNPSEQLAARALQTAERARARSLLDMLAEAHGDIREGVDPLLLERERSLQKELNIKDQMRTQLLKGKYSKREEESLNEEIKSITAEFHRVQAAIRSESPHYAALTQPQPLELWEIQQLVDEETLMLEYSLGEEQSYLWAVTPSTLECYDLPNRSDIEKRVNRIRELMLERQNPVEETDMQYRQHIKQADAEYWNEAAALSRLLLGPVSNRLASKRLLIVPDGMLQLLPFAALPKPQLVGNDALKNPQPLIVDHEIVNLPSASVLGLIRRETRQRRLPPKMVAVLADPVFEADDVRIQDIASKSKATKNPSLASRNVPAASLRRNIREGYYRLVATRYEADSIMDQIPEGMGLMRLGFNANRAAASDPELGQYRSVHFATHGRLDARNPELSSLVFSLFDEQGRPQDGHLRLHDIYNLKLPVELVVLSACNSGLGKEVRGEGLVGIVRGFMYAGAKRVLSSLWTIDDDATAALMKQFYKYLLQEGKSPAAALQSAQRDILKQKPRQAPYYWAAFVLQGEWK